MSAVNAVWQSTQLVQNVTFPLLTLFLKLEITRAFRYQNVQAAKVKSNPQAVVAKRWLAASRFWLSYVLLTWQHLRPHFTVFSGTTSFAGWAEKWLKYSFSPSKLKDSVRPMPFCPVFSVCPLGGVLGLRIVSSPHNRLKFSATFPTVAIQGISI